MREKMNKWYRILLVLLCGGLFLLPSKVVAKEVSHYAQDEVDKGWELFNEGDLDAALNSFNQAAIMDPSFAPAYYGQANTYGAQSKPALAIKFFKKTIELADPPMPEAYVNLGFMLMITGQEEEGFKMYNKALGLDPMNKEAHINLAQYYCNQLNGKKAWEHIRFAQSLKAVIAPEQLADMQSICPEDR